MDALLEVLQEIAEEAIRIITRTIRSDLFVRSFGSRCYDAAGPKSDWDFALVIPPYLASRRRLIRASIQQSIVDREMAKWRDTTDSVAKNDD